MPAKSKRELANADPLRTLAPAQKGEAMSAYAKAKHAQLYRFEIAIKSRDERIRLLEEALRKLFNDCCASDFNEHWESYTEAEALLATKETKI